MNRVKVGEKIITPERSQKLYNHSPDGFSWGYGGSGPSQLALAILLEFIPEDEAIEHYQDFKWDIIAKMDKDGPFVLSEETVMGWVKDKIL